jgi:hypothetical protein
VKQGFKTEDLEVEAEAGEATPAPAAIAQEE